MYCRERFWQDYYNVLNGGLNCVLVKCGDKRVEWSTEMRKNMSDRVKGEGNPMFGSSRIGHGKGRKASLELRKKFSVIAKNRLPSKESLEKRSKSMKGKMAGEKNPMFGSTRGRVKVVKISTSEEYDSIKICSTENSLNYTMLSQHLRKTRIFGIKYDDYKLVHTLSKERQSIIS